MADNQRNAERRRGRFPVIQLITGFLLLLLGIEATVLGSHWMGLGATLMGAAYLVLLRPWKRPADTDASRDRAIAEAAERAVKETMEAYASGGREALRARAGIRVRHDADGAVTITGRSTSWVILLGIQSVPLLAAAGFLLLKWNSLDREWLPVAIIQGLLLIVFMALAATIWRRTEYRVATDGIMLITRWLGLAVTRRSIRWGDMAEVRKTWLDEDLFPDVLLVPAQGRPIMLDTVLLATVCEEAAEHMSVVEAQTILDELNREPGGEKG